jgi:hypothetical protein
MKRRDFNLVVGASALGAALGSRVVTAADAPAWAFEADVAECCSCAIPCPCNFARPTEKRCDGNRLIQIREGQIGGASLAGIDFLVTFWMGKWTRIYVSAALSEAQYAAFERILPLAFTKFRDLARSVERVKLDVVREAETIRFASPASRVEMKLVPGLDGAPIRITGLPSPVFHDYVQYESVVHEHASEGERWSHTGTNGFTSRMIVKSV